MEVYNINQNKWIEHKSQTNFGHTYFPSIWMDPTHGSNILYIAGNYLGGSMRTKTHIGDIECIDFRENEPKWKIIWDQKTMHETFFGLPGTQDTTGIFSMCC